MAIFKSDAVPFDKNFVCEIYNSPLGATKAKVKFPLSGLIIEIVVCSLMLTGLI
jgi:hypothetical protein